MELELIELPSHLCQFNQLLINFEKCRVDLFGNLGRRQMYLWRWVYSAASLTTLESKTYKNINELSEYSTMIKTIGVMWDVLVDDIADDYPIERAKIMLPLITNEEEDLSLLNEKEKQYTLFARSLYQKVFALCQTLPGYTRHKCCLEKSYKFLIDNFHYSLQIRENYHQIQYSNYVRLLSNNMHMVINGIIDLMKIDYPNVIENDHQLRSLFVSAQRMGRIGNSVTTYDYEVLRGDFSSEVVALALELKLVDFHDFKEPSKLLEKINYFDIEALLWEFWPRYLSKIKLLEPKLTELKINEYAQGLVKLKQFHLFSKGKK